MASFIDDHRGDYGVDPIGRVLPIAPSTYYDSKAKQDDPSLHSARAQRDDELSVESPGEPGRFNVSVHFSEPSL